MKLLSYEDLSDRGIRYSRSQINRLIKVGRFPKPIRFSEMGRPAWPETEIDAWVGDLIAERDGASHAAQGGHHDAPA